jgi:uncharacterized protein
MKFIVLLGVLVVAYLIWRGTRLKGPDAAPPRAKPQAPGTPQDMVQCPVCSVHLPRGDAVTGANGLLYCSQEHLLQGGGRDG